MTISQTPKTSPPGRLSYMGLPDPFFAVVPNAQFPAPKLFMLNASLTETFSLSTDELSSAEGIALLSGAATLTKGPPIAMAYAGHQFGHYSRLLGDGRAMLIGEPLDRDGLRHDLHLKGSGLTPFSRGGDGKATLGSAVREYVMSEAMAALGVPTTRSLSIVETGEHIMRNGPAPGAVLARTARSHIRVGTFQFAAAMGDLDQLKALADFAIARLYPDLESEGAERYRSFLTEVAKSQASLIAQWMSLGFIHGVMNTDNASIAGETIDYGPCAFMDRFAFNKVFSSIDHQGRYAWNRQGEIGQWNMAQLAQAILPLLGDAEDAQVEAAQTCLSAYAATFHAAFETAMANKLGLSADHESLQDFISETFTALSEGGADFSRFFTALTRHVEGGPPSAIVSAFDTAEVARPWLETWTTLRQTDTARASDSGLMRKSNPVRIPRNHQVERALNDAESGNNEATINLITALQTPYEEDANFTAFEDAPDPSEIVSQTFCGT